MIENNLVAANVGKNVVNIGGIGVRAFGSMQEAVDAVIVNGRICPGAAFSISATVIGRCIDDENYKDLIAQGNMCHSDGAPITWLMNARGAKNSIRIAGCDLWLALMLRCAECDIPVYLVGAEPEVNLKTQQLLKDQHGVNVVGGCYSNPALIDEISAQISQLRPKMVSVALNMPKQERLINQLQKIHPDVFFMAVGGTYDFFVGNIKRAPLWVQKCGLEWLFRLSLEPWRIVRYKPVLQFVWNYCRRKL